MKMATLTKEQIDQQLKKAGVQPTTNLAGKFDDLDSFGDKESIREMYRKVGSYNKMLNERIVLINNSLTSAFPFTRENLYLFCAYTGSGKSTVAANIAYPLWKQKKKILVISNEETAQDVLFRIACLEKGLKFNDWKQGIMPMHDQMECLKLFPDIAQYVKIRDVTWEGGLTTKIEGIKGLLESVKDSGYSCAMIDYYQLIKDSLEDRTRTRYDVLNDLRIWLGQYIKGCEVPVVLFVQLYSQGKRPSKDIDMRIKECSAIIEPASVIVEVIPNFDDSTSDFLIHKDRFGTATGKKIVCPFEKGRFLNQLNQREMAERQLDKLTQSTHDDKHQKVPDLQRREEK